MLEIYKHTPKVWERRSTVGKSYFLFWCPACDQGHVFWVGTGFNHPQKWEFDNNYQHPTFTPSLRISVRIPMEDDHGVRQSDRLITRCHLYVTHGDICYCDDCPHAYAGKTVPMPDIPDGYGF